MLFKQANSLISMKCCLILCNNCYKSTWAFSLLLSKMYFLVITIKVFTGSRFWSWKRYPNKIVELVNDTFFPVFVSMRLSKLFQISCVAAHWTNRWINVSVWFLQRLHTFCSDMPILLRYALIPNILYINFIWNQSKLLSCIWYVLTNIGFP